jgi:hypothetical protein
MLTVTLTKPVLPLGSSALPPGGAAVAALPVAD